MLYEEKIIETIPVGPLGLIPLKSCTSLGAKVDAYLVDWRRERESEHKSTIAFAGYQRDSYIVPVSTPRFGSGEAKGLIQESVRGDDLYIMVDVCNYSLTYSLFGMTNHMSPDDHFQDLKRVIAAAAGKARRINVIMPFLYESRQHKRSGRESLDCALALKELVYLGVENIITFDAHDPRVQNAIPLKGFETVQPVGDVALEKRIILDEVGAMAQSAGISAPLDEDAATLLATTYHELRQGISAEGMRLKKPAAVMSTAEAVSVYYQTLMSAWYYGGPEQARHLDERALAENLAGAVAKESREELAAVREYFSTIVQKKAEREGGAWKRFYEAGMRLK